jgi:DNA helicase HerA-like ATPase
LGEQISNVQSGDIFVIDLAPLPSVEEQALVIGDALKCINGLYSVRHPMSRRSIFSDSKNIEDRDHSRPGTNPPRYVLIFLDEINRFMPKSHYFPKFNSVSDEIMRMVIGGRSRGNILFSAQQFKTATDYRLQENIDLHIFAKLGLSELLTEPYYSMVDDMVKKNIARLERGEMILVHPAFRYPLKIWFPPSFQEYT